MSAETPDQGAAGGIEAVGATSPGRVLLVFPPVYTLTTHPEVGIPALTAALRAHGHDVCQVDLNVELLYRHLRDRSVLRRAISGLDEPSGAWLRAIPNLHRRRWSELRTRVHALGVPQDATATIDRDLCSYVDHMESLYPLRPGDARMPGDVALVPAGDDDGLIDELFAEGPGLWARQLGLARVLLHAFVKTDGYDPDSVAAAVFGPNWLLDDFYQQRLDPLLSPSPLLVGVALHSAHQLVPALRIARRVKARDPEVCVVMGGPWCSAAGNLILRTRELLFRDVDAFVLGEGEGPLEHVLSCLTEGGRVTPAPGVLVATSTAAELDRLATPVPVDELPAPDFSDLPLCLYPEPKFVFRTVRGCYWGRCKFCYHVHPWQRLAPPASGPPSPHLVDRLVAWLQTARDQLGITRWATADNATPPRVLLHVARALRTAGVESSWHALARFDDEFSPDLCREIAQAGCQELAFGLETTWFRELERLNKGINRRVVLKTLEACRAGGVSAAVFVLDTPTQPLEKYRETLRFLCDHHELVDRFIPLRFELGRNAPVFAHPDAMHLRVAPGASTSLDVFDLPFTAEAWHDRNEFLEVTEEYALRLIAAKHGAGNS
jgi:anaerobic magnesium-protoporphyrin IX monomethyl ester cyclase